MFKLIKFRNYNRHPARILRYLILSLRTSVSPTVLNYFSQPVDLLDPVGQIGRVVWKI